MRRGNQPNELWRQAGGREEPGRDTSGNSLPGQSTAVLGDRYELGAVLGQGGMARVYRGTDRTLGRAVAIKVLADPFARDQGFVQRFRREARSAARLNHPNIVSVYDSGSDNHTHFIVMELVKGVTLETRLKRDGPLAPDEATRIGVAIVRALSAAHERGVVHRDVKPGNVMLTEAGGVKVVDFGIARASGAEDITRSGLILGSASYVSPEQAQGSSGDERSDLYGLGCVLYQMLTGRPPFVAEDPLASLYLHVNESPAPPSTIRPVPGDLERVVLRCLEKDPDRRFASASELETALASAPMDEPTSTMVFPPIADEPTIGVRRGERQPTPTPSDGAPTSQRRRPSKRSWLLASVAAGLLLVAGSMALLADPIRPPTKAELREARQEARAETATGSPTLEPIPTAGEAVDRLRDAIEAAAAAGEIFDEDVTAELLDDTHEVKEAHATGDAERLGVEFPDLIDEIQGAIAGGQVSDEAAGEIGESLDDLILAIENDPLESPSSSQEDGDDDD